MRLPWFLILLFLVVFFLDSCTHDVLLEPIELSCEGMTPTYEADVREILEQTCTYSSNCHLGSAFGSYDSYNGLLSDLENGSFRQRVVVGRLDPNLGMPPNYAPEGRARDLDSTDLAIITCWLQAGYPEE